MLSIRNPGLQITFNNACADLWAWHSSSPVQYSIPPFQSVVPLPERIHIPHAAVSIVYLYLNLFDPVQAIL